MSGSHVRSVVKGVALSSAALIAVGCSQPMESSHEHHNSLTLGKASVEINQKLAELRDWSAPFHNLNQAAAAGYSANIGCIDETLGGADPSVARGMGYHVTRADVNIVDDGVVDINTPEFLVYAPGPRDAELPKEERLAHARLVGFDYFVSASDWPGGNVTPPELMGQKFNWNEVFQGWMFHIYLWGNNPEGMFEDFNAKSPLCTTLLDP